MKSIFKKMIENSRNQACIISFGLGLTTFNCSVGDEVPVRVSGAFNQNEFILQQNETADLTVFYYFLSPNTTFVYKQTTAFFDKIVNEKAQYRLQILNENDLILQDYIIFFNISQTPNHPPNQNTLTNNYINKYVLTKAVMNVDNNWISVGPVFSFSNLQTLQLTQWNIVTHNLIDFGMINITNIAQITTTGGFTFPAVNSKVIQVEMQNKNGIILKSNKINLIVN